MTVYKPTGLSTYSIYEEQGIAQVMVQSDIPREMLKPLLELAFLYSHLAIIVNLQDRHNPNYMLAQSGDRADMIWLLNALSRFEDGWQLREGILYSPISSQLPTATVGSAFHSAVKQVVSAQSTSDKK